MLATKANRDQAVSQRHGIEGRSYFCIIVKVDEDVARAFASGGAWRRQPGI